MDYERRERGHSTVLLSRAGGWFLGYDPEAEGWVGRCEATRSYDVTDEILIHVSCRESPVGADTIHDEMESTGLVSALPIFPQAQGTHGGGPRVASPLLCADGLVKPRRHAEGIEAEECRWMCILLDVIYWIYRIYTTHIL